MFYDNSEPDFPNWWDTIEGEPEENREEPTADTPSESDVQTPESDVQAPESDVQTPSSRIVVEQNSTISYEVVRGYDREVVNRIWEFAEVVPGNDSELWRKDEWGNWIYKLDYGRRDSEFGWEIFDPGVGRHKQGVYAMRPMQWESFIRRYETL